MMRGQKAFEPYRRADYQTAQPTFAHATLPARTDEEIAAWERELQAIRDRVAGEQLRLRELLDSHPGYKAITRGS